MILALIGILIGWLIAGILLVFFSGLMYYYNTIGLLGLSAILLLGVIILMISTFHFISWQTKWKVSGKPYSEALKSMFTILTVISIIIFGVGGIGYLLGALGVFVLDSQTRNTLFALLTVGLLCAIGSILSWIYVERSTPSAISSAIAKQQHILNQIKGESEVIGTEIRSKGKDVTESIENAIKAGERNKKELERR